ncbi:MAG: hypothetical protein NW205_03705 [Hyphomicrobiaceae bacterium]|nr:hypothetical protein [Hyphomicrobiaceae bacterium]
MADVDALKKTFDSEYSRAEAFLARFVEQLEELFSSRAISLAVPIERRIKGWRSCQDKIERDQIAISNILELDDFIGVRVILLFKRDLDAAIEIIGQSLSVRSIEDKASDLGVDVFGYQSHHFIVALPADWLALPTLSKFRDIKVELQVRTAAQHIWAAASHVLQYKNEASVPSHIRRSISRVSALLETVDLEFDRVLQSKAEYTSGQSIDRNEETLNVDSLRRVLDELLPPANKSASDEYDLDKLLDELRERDITTVADIKKLFDRNLGGVLASDAKIARAGKSSLEDMNDFDDSFSFAFNGRRYRLDDPDRLKQGVYWSHIGLVRQMLNA